MFDSEGGPSRIDDPLGLRNKNERLVRLTGVLAIALRRQTYVNDSRSHRDELPPILALGDRTTQFRRSAGNWEAVSICAGHGA